MLRFSTFLDEDRTKTHNTLCSQRSSLLSYDLLHHLFIHRVKAFAIVIIYRKQDTPLLFLRIKKTG